MVAKNPSAIELQLSILGARSEAGLRKQIVEISKINYWRKCPNKWNSMPRVLDCMNPRELARGGVVQARIWPYANRCNRSAIGGSKRVTAVISCRKYDMIIIVEHLVPRCFSALVRMRRGLRY